MHVDYFFPPSTKSLGQRYLLMCSLEPTAYKGACCVSPAQDTGTEKAGATLLLHIEGLFIESLQWPSAGLDR